MNEIEEPSAHRLFPGWSPLDLCARFSKNGKWSMADFDRANAIREDYFKRKTQP